MSPHYQHWFNQPTQNASRHRGVSVALSLTHSRVIHDPWMISVEIDRLIDALSAPPRRPPPPPPLPRVRDRQNAMIDTLRGTIGYHFSLNVTRSRCSRRHCTMFPYRICTWGKG